MRHLPPPAESSGGCCGQFVCWMAWGLRETVGRPADLTGPMQLQNWWRGRRGQQKQDALACRQHRMGLMKGQWRQSRQPSLQCHTTLVFFQMSFVPARVPRSFRESLQLHCSCPCSATMPPLRSPPLLLVWLWYLHIFHYV